MDLGVEQTCRSTSVESDHVKLSALTNGTLLDMTEFGVSDSVESSAPAAHNVRGVLLLTRTCKVGTLRQALQNSNDASCSSSVEVYQHFPPPSHAA